MVPSRVSAASALLLGAALAGIAFGAAGGTELGRTTIVEVLAVLASGALVAVVLYRGGYGGPGSVPLAAFAALAGLTTLSVTWSIVPETSYVEAGRTMAYLFVFAAGVALARLAPRRPEIALGGVLLAAGLASAYALASRVWPATLAANELSNRIGAPFQYWNAVGTTAALAVPALLWLGSRRTGRVALRALAYPALGVSIVAILLTQSRGALVAAGIAAVIWFALVPLRLRSLPVLLVPAAGAGAVSAWALARNAFSQTLQPLSARESVAGDFGLLLLLMVVLLFLAGLAVNVGLARSVGSMRVRRRVGIAALAVACVIPLVALTSVAVSDGGLGGSIRDRVDQLTSETDTAPQQGAGRLTAVSSTRGKYWREAGRVFDDRPVAGVGAGAFEVARLRHRSDAAVTRHAHGYPAQTLADLGILGLGLSLALLLAWLVSAARTTGLHPRRMTLRRSAVPPPARRDWDGERIAFTALALVALVFGLQSAIDWTWFVPGPAAMAFVAAGMVAGRGPVAAVGGPADPFPAVTPRHGEGRMGPALVAAAGMLAAVLVAWAVWQPEASQRSVDHALDQASGGDFRSALDEADSAADADPLSPAPLFARADILSAARLDAQAGHTLERAVLRFPGDPDAWIRLARFQLYVLDAPRPALTTLRGALYLDPYSALGRSLYLTAQAAQRVVTSQSRS